VAVDIFLKLDGITGESTDSQHRGEIDLDSWSFGESNAAAHTGGGGAGRVSMQDIHVTGKTSIASPQLMLACATGKHIKDGQITVRKAGVAGKGGLEFLVIKFKLVLITSVQETGHSGDDGPTESITFAFEAIEIKYTEQNADGGAGAASDFTWDLKTNRVV